MDTDVTIIARKSPGINAVVSLLVIGLLLAFSVFSIRDGFDTTARPWAERRLWMWWLSAYVVSPALVIMLFVNFWRLARNDFVAILLQGRHVYIFDVKRTGFALDDLIAMKVKIGALVFVLKDGSEVPAGLLGLIGGTDALVDRIRTLKPDVRID